MKTIIVVCLLLATHSLGQDCPHPAGAIERFEHVRAIPPQILKITLFDGKKIEYVLQDGRQTKLGSLEITSGTFLPKDFEKNYRKGKYWVVYCDNPEHMTVYQISLEKHGHETTAVTKKDVKP